MKKDENNVIKKSLSLRLALLAFFILFFSFAFLFAFFLISLDSGSYPFTFTVTDDFLKKLLVLVCFLFISNFVIFYLCFKNIYKKLTPAIMALRDMREGKEPETLPVNAGDEITLLNEEVNEFNARLKSKDLQREERNVLGKPDYERFCALAAKRFVSVLFIQIENWENKAYIISAKRLSALLAKYCSIVLECSKKTGAISVDCGLSSFAVVCAEERGALSAERDVYNSLRCALLIRHALYQYNSRQKNRSLRIKVNMGVHFGKITAAIIPHGEEYKLKIMGANINLVHKISDFNSDCNFDILMSEAAYRLVDGYVIADTVALDEKDDNLPERLYALVNIKSKDRKKQNHPRTIYDVRKIINW
ncbi:MAG: hypothetical protein LBC53_01640 [Spirochaetaceae bacterium]|jgi:hypothetical protein|nr:hypothetical protein [Spirochaetaceae bacterium]